jgi:two-component system invasion response regulator UvrY
VLSTGYFYSYNSAGKLVNLFKRDKSNVNQADRLILNENELTFLKLASTDMTYKEIATVMEISPRTIDNYRDALFLKLNVKSRVGLAIYAIKSGVITLEY